MKRLTPEEREFFSLVTRAATCNPFSDERVEIDLSISGLFPGASAAERFEKMVSAVKQRIGRLEASGRNNIEMFSGKDRKLAENAFIFDIFYRYMPGFDEFIQKQIHAGDRPLKVPFAGKALALLRTRGFPPEDARRYFALCFQLRRAFYFIDRSLVGRSEGMKLLRRKLWNNVFTHDIQIYNQYLWNRMEDFATLILGETGTGKGTAAVAIGRSGYIPFDEDKGCFVESFSKSFVSLNLSQFSETLIESELFGHKKGAFTGATEDYKGIFDCCSPYGAIFLDEIGEVSKPVQIKLLQVIQERRFNPVGSHETHRFSGRVIAATNRSMEELRGKKMLRDDFYYRLCSDILQVPPLRQRIAENPHELDDLLTYTVFRLMGSPSPQMVQMVKTGIHRDLGANYPWPGNVRELEQCVRRMVLNHTCTADHMGDASDLSTKLQKGIQTGSLDAHQLICAYCRLLHQRHHTYEAVSRITDLDRRTVKKYIDWWEKNN